MSVQASLPATLSSEVTGSITNLHGLITESIFLSVYTHLYFLHFAEDKSLNRLNYE